LVAVAVGWFLSIGVRMVYPTILPHLRADFGLDRTAAGLLITTMWAAYALGQFPSGLLDDRFGGKRLLVLSTVISGFAVLLVVAAGSVGLLFVGTLLFGLTTSLYGVSRFTILVTNYPKHGGTAVGLMLAAGDLGTTLLPPLGGLLAVGYGWEVSLSVSIPLFLVAAVGIHATVPNIDSESESDDRLVTTVRKVADAVRNRNIALVVVVQTIGYCIWQSFTGFYPTYLIEIKGVSATMASFMFGGFFAMGILIKPLVGTAYDAYGIRGSLPFVLSLCSRCPLSRGCRR
jgi:MFS family permease